MPSTEFDLFADVLIGNTGDSSAPHSSQLLLIGNTELFLERAIFFTLDISQQNTNITGGAGLPRYFQEAASWLPSARRVISARDRPRLQRLSDYRRWLADFTRQKKPR